MDEPRRADAPTGVGDILARLRIEVDEIVGLITRPTCSERQLARLERPGSPVVNAPTDRRDETKG